MPDSFRSGRFGWGDRRRGSVLLSDSLRSAGSGWGDKCRGGVLLPDSFRGGRRAASEMGSRSGPETGAGIARELRCLALDPGGHRHWSWGSMMTGNVDRSLFSWAAPSPSNHLDVAAACWLTLCLQPMYTMLKLQCADCTSVKMHHTKYVRGPPSPPLRRLWACS